MRGRIDGPIDFSQGMKLRAMTTGDNYRVQSADDNRVVLTGPRGSLGVDREKLEGDVRRCLVQVVSWP